MRMTLLHMLIFGQTLLCSLSGFTQSTLEDSLQLYYAFDNSFTDSSVNQFHGMPFGGVGFGTDHCGNLNSAALFDGVNDYIDAGTTFDYEFRTVSCWFLAHANTFWQNPTQQDAISLTYGSMSVDVLPSSELVARAGGAGASSMSPTTATNQWYHVVLIRDGPDLRYYLDAELVNTSPSNTGGSVSFATDHLTVGVSRTLNLRFLDGLVDELRVYNRAITDCEIRQLYCAAAPCLTPRDTTIEAGTTLNIYNQGGPNDTIAWLINGVLVQANQDSIAQLFNTGGNFIVVAYGEDSCCAMTDTIFVTVTDSCDINTEFSPSVMTGCPGDTFAFLNTTVDTSGLVYRWAIDGDTVSNDTHFTTSFMDPGQYLISLTARDTNCSETFSITITVNNIPIDTLNPIHLCHSDTFAFNASGGTSYQWSDSTYLSNDTIPNPLAFPDSSMMFSVTITRANDCDSVVYYPVNINYNDSDSVSIATCDSIISPSGKYVWFETGTYQDTIPTSKGCDSIITVQLTKLDSLDSLCQVIDTTIVDTTIIDTSIVDTLIIDSLDFDCALTYPNVFTPNADGINDVWHIEDPCNQNPEAQIIIYNRWGQLVWTGGFANHGWDGAINGEPASQGVYFFIYEGDNDTQRGSFSLLRND